MITIAHMSETLNKAELLRRLFVGLKMVEHGTNQFMITIPNVNNWAVNFSSDEMIGVLREAFDKTADELKEAGVDVASFIETTNEQFEVNIKAMQTAQSIQAAAQNPS